MIYIVHGDDFSKSRNLVLNQQKKLGVESRLELDISDTSPESLFSCVRSGDLFGNVLYVVLNISKAGRTNMEPYVGVLKNIPENTVLIILSDKSLTATNVFIKNAQVLGAKIVSNTQEPLSSTFKFVDAVFYKRRQEAYKELEKLLIDQTEPLEIFSMLVWGLRNVSQAVFNNQPFFNGKNFIKNKSYAQAKLFNRNSIKNLYSDFFNMDREVKTGGIEGSMLIPLSIEKVLNS